MLIRLFSIILCACLWSGASIAAPKSSVNSMESTANSLESTEDSMEKAAQDMGFKHDDVSYSAIYTRLAGVGFAMLIGAGALVVLRNKFTQRKQAVGVDAKGKKIVTIETTQAAYGVRTILIDVNGHEVLIVQTKDSHTVTQLVPNQLSKTQLSNAD